MSVSDCVSLSPRGGSPSKSATVSPPADIATTASADGVQVYAGNAGPFMYACIRYEHVGADIALIVGLVVGLSVLLIIVVLVVAVVCVCKRRGEGKRSSDAERNEIDMSPVGASYYSRHMEG